MMLLNLNRFKRLLLVQLRINGGKTMEDELDSMLKSQVQNLVDLSLDQKAIRNKYILKIKQKVDGSIENYKNLLVAKDYTQ